MLNGETLDHQTGKFAKEIGQIMGVQVLIEAPINSSSPYFSSSWRRDKNFKHTALKSRIEEKRPNTL